MSHFRKIRTTVFFCSLIPCITAYSSHEMTPHALIAYRAICIAIPGAASYLYTRYVLGNNAKDMYGDMFVPNCWRFKKKGERNIVKLMILDWPRERRIAACRFFSTIAIGWGLGFFSLALAGRIHGHSWNDITNALDRDGISNLFFLVGAPFLVGAYVGR